MARRKHSNPFKSNERLVEKRMLQAFKDSLATAETPIAKLPPSPTMQERLDRQATDWLQRQPRILSGLDDFQELERLALSKDEKGMLKFLRQEARKAVPAQLTYWKKFFRLQRQERGRQPQGLDGWIATAASMKANGKSWGWIAKTLFPTEWQDDPYDTKHRVVKAVKDYCRRNGLPPYEKQHLDDYLRRNGLPLPPGVEEIPPIS